MSRATSKPPATEPTNPVAEQDQNLSQQAAGQQQGDTAQSVAGPAAPEDSTLLAQGNALPDAEDRQQYRVVGIDLDIDGERVAEGATVSLTRKQASAIRHIYLQQEDV